jgi:uncharacterized membrane protein (DUF2068 family)
METQIAGRHRPNLTLRLIALFKFCKAALLVAVGLGVLQLVQPGVAAQVRDWVDPLAIGPARRLAQKAISLVSGLSPRRLEVLALGAFLYACLYLVEGVGLWLEKRWAEYLIAIATLAFVPVEVFALTRRVSLPRLTALSMNLIVAAYMIHCLRQARGAPGAGPVVAGQHPLEDHKRGSGYS